MASVVSHAPGLPRAALRSIRGGASMNALGIDPKYIAQSNASSKAPKPAPKSRREMSVWERSQIPKTDANGMTSFERAAHVRSELREDDRYKALKAMSSGGGPTKLRDSNPWMGLIEQQEREKGIGPRQEVRKFAPGSDSSRLTEGLSAMDAAEYSNMVESAESITKMLQESISGFEPVDSNSEAHKVIYQDEDGLPRSIKVKVNNFVGRHLHGFHNGARRGIDAYQKDLNFGALHQKDFYDPYGTQKEVVQSIMSAENFVDYLQETGIELDLMEHGGLARQRETLMAINEELEKRGMNSPKIVFNQKMLELGHSSGVSQVGEICQSDVFLGDPTKFENITSVETDAHVFNRVEADQIQLHEAIKQIAEWKIKKAMESAKKSGSEIPTEVTVSIFREGSCEHIGEMDKLLRGQGNEYTRHQNGEIRHSTHEITITPDGTKFVGPRGNFYDDTVITPGFADEQFESLFGKGPMPFHSSTDHSNMAWHVEDQDVIPSQLQMLRKALAPKVLETRIALSTTPNDFLRAQAVTAMGASRLEELTDSQIESFLIHQLTGQTIDTKATSSGADTASSSQQPVFRRRVPAGPASSAATETEKDTATASSPGGRDALSHMTRLPSSPVQGVARLAQNV